MQAGQKAAFQLGAATYEAAFTLDIFLKTATNRPEVTYGLGKIHQHFMTTIVAPDAAKFNHSRWRAFG
jgi:hypothetical protein